MQRHWSSSIPVRPCGLWDAAFIGRFSAYCGFFAAIIFWSGVLMVGFLQPEYQPFADTVSKMGRVGRSFAGMINGTLIATGILLGLFALSLPSLNESLSSTRKMIAGFGFIGLAGAGLLPCDQICAGWSLPNILHTLPVAIGLYLPPELSTPIVIGSLVFWWVGRFSGAETKPARTEKGILFGSGMVAVSTMSFPSPPK